MESIYLTLADEVDSTKEVGEKLEPREFCLIIKAKDEKEASKYANEYLNDTYYDFDIPNDFEDITEKIKNMDEDYGDGYEYIIKNLLTEGNVAEIDNNDSILYYFE